MNFGELRQLCYDQGGNNIGGWLETIDQEWLAKWLTSLKFDYDPVVAEVGVFQGGGSLIFLTALPTAKFYAVDDWKGGPASPGFANIKEAFIDFTKPFKDRINLIDGDSIEIGEKWKVPLDICFVDACHDDDNPRLDILNFGKWVKLGGYLIVDDLKMIAVRAAVDSSLINNSNWKIIKQLEKGDIMVFQKVRQE